MLIKAPARQYGRLLTAARGTAPLRTNRQHPQRNRQNGQLGPPADRPESNRSAPRHGTRPHRRHLDHVSGALAPATTLSGPSVTARSAAGSATIVISTSARLAASAGVAAGTPRARPAARPYRPTCSTQSLDGRGQQSGGDAAPHRAEPDHRDSSHVPAPVISARQRPGWRGGAVLTDARPVLTRIAPSFPGQGCIAPT